MKYSSFSLLAYYFIGAEETELLEEPKSEVKSKRVKKSTTPKRQAVKFERTFEEGGAGIVYESSQRGNKLLHYMGHKYIKNNVHGKTVYWKCTKWHSGCKARAITNLYETDSCYTKNVHNHDCLEYIDINASASSSSLV